MRLTIVVAVLLCCVSSTASACSCAGGGGPACEEAWSKYTEVVFLGKVIGIHRALKPNLAWLNLEFGDLKQVEFEIEEPYLGISGHKVTGFTNWNEAACGYPFVKGERYVVYAAKEKGQVFVSLCSHTRPAKYAEEDISYLRSLPSLPATATIQGSLWRYTHDPNFKPKFQPSLMDHYRPPEQDYRAMAPVPGIKVVARAENGTEQSAVVDSDGSWRISGLSPGSYSVTALVDQQMFMHFYRNNVTVVAKGCARVDMRVELNGRIAGTLTHSPPQDDWVVLYVFAMPVNNPDMRHPAIEARLEPKQTDFELAPLPPGKYILGVYLAKRVDLDANTHTYRDAAPTFYPGVADLKSATPIKVGESQKLSGFDFRMMDREFMPQGWRCCDKK
jgi:hypothetical protein